MSRPDHTRSRLFVLGNVAQMTATLTDSTESTL